MSKKTLYSEDGKKKRKVQVIKNPYGKNVPEENIRREDTEARDNKVLYFASMRGPNDQWIGDEITKKMKGDTRLWLQKPNGLSAANDFRQFRGDMAERQYR